MYPDSIYLAAQICGVVFDEASGPDLEAVENALDEQFEITFDAFENLVGKLLRYTMPVKAPLSGALMQAFGTLDEKGIFTAIMRNPATTPDGQPLPVPHS